MNKTMRNIVLALIVGVISILGLQSWVTADWFGNSTPDVYLNQDWSYGLKEWVLETEAVLWNVVTDRTFAQYVVDVVKYLLTFLALVGVLIIIYAGFTILVSWWDEEKLKTGRRMIFYAVIGIIIIFFAAPIVFWIEEVFNKA